MKNLGDLIKNTRLSRGMSVVRLAQLSGISRRQIHLLESSEVKDCKLNTLHLLSEALDIDLVSYAFILGMFNDFEEYSDFVSLAKFQNDGDFEEMRKFIEKSKDIDTLDVSNRYTKQILLCKSFIEVGLKNDYISGLKYCYRILGVDRTTFRVQDIEKYVKTDIDYGTIIQISHYLCNIEKYTESYDISVEILNIIKNKYYNSDLPRYYEIPNYIIRCYGAAHFSKAFSLYYLKRYQESIDCCDQGISVMKDKMLYYTLDILYYVKFLCLNELNMHEEAVLSLNSCISLCMITGNYKNLDEIRIEVEKHYHSYYEEMNKVISSLQ